MSLSVHSVTVEVFVPLLGNLAGMLRKAKNFAETKKLDAGVLESLRLTPDMFALRRQVQLTTDFAKNSTARLAGIEAPKFADEEQTLDELIQRIERTIERVAGEPYGNGVTNVTPRLEMIGGSSQKVFRVCTFTGSWSKNTLKTVTFLGVTTTPNTVSASNLFANVAGVTVTSTTKNCAIAKDGTAWYLIAAEC